MSRLLLALLLLSLVSGQLSGDERQPVFQLDTVGGKPTRGQMLSLSGKWELRLTGQAQPLTVKDWVSLRREGVPVPSVPTQAQLILSSGDCIPVHGEDIQLNAERIAFSCSWLGSGKQVRVPLSSVAIWWRTALDTANDVELFRRKLLAESRRHDAVVLRNGDTVEGVLSRLGRKYVEIEVNRKRISVEANQVALVAMSTVLASAAQPKETFARVILADGSRLSLRSASCDGTTLKGATLFGAELEIPLDKLLALDLLQGQALYLSDLKPARYEHTPYLGISWSLGVNCSVARRDLRLAGSVFDRGLGMHSACRVRYAVPAGYRFFEARVGLDDVTGRLGSVRLRILIDGKECDPGLKRDLTHRHGILPVRLDVAGARELTLIVDFGQGGDVGDHVNWADARFLR
jgi:hypothetical protein